MPSAKIIYCKSYFCLQVSCNITLNLIHIPCLHWKIYWAHDPLALLWVIWFVVKLIYMFFQGVYLICCLHLLGMLGFHCSYIYHLFLVWWSLYFSWCSALVKNQHLSLTTNIIRYQNFSTWNCLFTCLPFESFMI